MDCGGRAAAATPLWERGETVLNATRKFQKRQRAGAVHDAAAKIWTAGGREAFWTAPTLWRFAGRTDWEES